MRRNRPVLWLLLGIAVLMGLACVAIPMYVVRPFRPQAPGELEVALALYRFGPAISALAAMATLLLVRRLWPAARPWPKLAAAAAALFAVVLAAFTHVNIFELMFHPIDSAEFVSAGKAKVDADDMVLSVHLNSIARAYPVRMMAYHHVINDRLNGTPIAATY